MSVTVKKVVLKGVRSFVQETSFDFTNTREINTASGINGSGKSTLFKALTSAQRAFFSLQTTRQDATARVTSDLLGLFNEKGAFIAVTLSIQSESTTKERSFKLVCNERTAETISWKIESAEEDHAAIQFHWDINNPQGIIVYVDSARFISEADFSSREVSMSKSKSIDDLVTDYIFSPEQLFESTYARIISDYARQRISPSNHRWDMPHVAAKILLRSLLKYIFISNFTTQARDGQFVLQAKRNMINKAGLYDVRSFSSGEKTLFYILHFICYVKNISLLVIDEPENNLHENMLAQFVSLLENITTTKDFPKLLLKLAKENNIKPGKNAPKDFNKLYKSHQLNQVFLLTHSRSLIYNVFNVGSNYYVENGLKSLEFDEAEQVMRSIGLSKIYDRVLFVEGETDVAFIEAIVAPHNVKVKALGGCTQVISAYRSYLRLKSHVRETQFCFMIDRDTRNEDSIGELRNEDPDSFDRHFVVLDRHELENYFLDPALFQEVFTRVRALIDQFPADPPDELEVEARMRAIADESRPQVLLKTVHHLNSRSLGSVLDDLTSKNLPLTNHIDYQARIMEVLSGIPTSAAASELKANYRKACMELSQWDTRWKSLCDGKRTLRLYIAEVAGQLGTNKETIERVLTKAAMESNTADAHVVIVDLVSRLTRPGV
jgi:predicted ATPase